MEHIDEWDARYKAGKDYDSTPLRPYFNHESAESNEIDVTISCACGAVFDVFNDMMPIKCTGCDRIYKVVVNVMVGGVENARTTA